MTPNEQVKLCEKCEHCKKLALGWYGRYFLGCYAKEYHGKWVAEIERCPIGKLVEE